MRELWITQILQFTEK